MAEEWRGFDDKAKELYVLMEEKDRERFDKEKKIYDSKKKEEIINDKGDKKSEAKLENAAVDTK